jgi:hypothetical protein
VERTLLSAAFDVDLDPGFDVVFDFGFDVVLDLGFDPDFLWGQPPKPALSEVEGAVHRANPD